VVEVAGTGVVAGDRRLRRWAVRLLTGAGIAGLAWLFAAFLNSGVASADELPSTGSSAEGSTVTSTAVSDTTPMRMNSAASTGSDSDGLLGSLLGTVGNTVTGSVSSLTSSLSDTVSGTVSTLTGAVNGVTTTLGSTVDSVSQVLSPTSSDQSSGSGSDAGTGSGSGADTQSLPAGQAPTKHAVPVRNVTKKVVSPAATARPAGRPATRPVGHHATVPAARHTSASTSSPAGATHRAPHRQAPDPAPQPTPDPAVPATSVTSGHGDGGSARGTQAVYASGSFTRSLAALGLHSDRSVSWTARSQGLPATSPD
jgi:hypothetical protein